MTIDLPHSWWSTDVFRMTVCRAALDHFINWAASNADWCSRPLPEAADKYLSKDVRKWPPLVAILNTQYHIRATVNQVNNKYMELSDVIRQYVNNTAVQPWTSAACITHLDFKFPNENILANKADTAATTPTAQSTSLSAQAPLPQPQLPPLPLLSPLPPPSPIPPVQASPQPSLYVPIRQTQQMPPPTQPSPPASAPQSQVDSLTQQFVSVPTTTAPPRAVLKPAAKPPAVSRPANPSLSTNNVNSNGELSAMLIILNRIAAGVDRIVHYIDQQQPPTTSVTSAAAAATAAGYNHVNGATDDHMTEHDDDDYNDNNQATDGSANKRYGDEMPHGEPSRKKQRGGRTARPTST